MYHAAQDPVEGAWTISSSHRTFPAQAGARFVVLAGEDAVILKTIETPALSQFDDLLRAARRAAREAGLKQADLAAAIRDLRDTK